MVDKPNPMPGSGTDLPGQGGTPPTGQPPAPQDGEGKQFLTREEFTAALSNLDKKWSDSQSRLGFKQATFEQRVQGDLAALKQSLDLMEASGVQITPEQKQAMRNNVIARAFETPAGQTGAQAAQPPTGTPAPGEKLPEDYEEPPDPVTAQAWQIMEQMGVDITVNDPEFQLLDRSKDPNAFLASVKPAIEAKIKRLYEGSLQATQPPHMPTNLGVSGTPTNDYYGKIVEPDKIWSDMQRKSS